LGRGTLIGIEKLRRGGNGENGIQRPGKGNNPKGAERVVFGSTREKKKEKLGRMTRIKKTQNNREKRDKNGPSGPSKQISPAGLVVKKPLTTEGTLPETTGKDDEIGRRRGKKVT